MIDIIIPAYNANDFIDNLLFSLTTQTMRDSLKVYIVNDCSKKDYKENIDKFHNILNIQEIKAEKNGGPGLSRQLGLDNSDSDFIVFIDADDLLYDCFAIERLYTTITEENQNVVSGNFIEEVEDGEIFEHGENSIWLHGKIFRRSFLEEYNIRFNDTRANEDTGFNKLALMCSDYYYLDEFTYVWKCNNKSITRSSDYSFYGLDGFNYNMVWAVKESEKRNINEGRIAYLVYESIVDLYYRYIYYKDYEDRDLILKWAKDMKKCYLKYKDKIDYYDKEEVVFKVINFLYHSMLGPDMFLENSLSFDEFIDLIP